MARRLRFTRTDSGLDTSGVRLSMLDKLNFSFLTFAALLCLGAAVAMRERPLAVVLASLAAAACAGQAVWFHSQAAGLSQKIDKLAVGVRRYQNIARYFESVLQDSTDIIFTIDQEGLILKFNSGAQLHFKYTQAEIVGKPFKDLFVNEADNRKILDTVLQTGKSADEEIPMKTRDGEIIHLNISISEMKDENGAIKGMVVTAKDITEKKKLEMELLRKNQMLAKLAITDNLTQLYNTRHFYEQVKRELTRFRRSPERPLSLILLDVDHFKEYNDSEGHQKGDEVLRSLAHAIKACIRKDIDIGFRYGGDEFIVLLPETKKELALRVAERIQKQFGAFKFGTTSLSIGIAEVLQDEDEVSLLKRADEAMYCAKKGGRSRIMV